MLGLSERERMAKAARMRSGEFTSPVAAAMLELATRARRRHAPTAEIATLDDQLERLVQATARRWLRSMQSHRDSRDPVRRGR
jgi:hypothetical protein